MPFSYRSRLRRGVELTVATVFLMVLGACGEEKTSEGKALVPVVVAKAVLTEYTPSVTMTGAIAARVETDLSFRVSGRITERLADTGQHVQAGDILARLDPEEQKADLATAEANLTLAEAQEAQAASAFARQNELLQKGLTTRGDFETAEASLISARSSVDSARSARDTARDALGYTELRADADGIITARSAEVGQVAQAAQTMFRLARDGERDAVFHVQESVFLGREGFSGNGVKVSVALLNRPDITANGIIREISPTIDAQTGTVRMKAGLSDPSEEMALGAAVSGTVMMPAVKVIRVPWTAMGSRDGKPAVWVMDAATQVVDLRPVSVSVYDRGETLIADGIDPGTDIVVDGVKFLRPGQKVRSLGEKKL